MGDAVVKFCPKTLNISSENCKLTLKVRSENIVKLPTKYLGHRLISKRELIPGIYLAETLTEAINEKCITSIINILEEDFTLDQPQVF
jgi:hypothetical protein